MIWRSTNISMTIPINFLSRSTICNFNSWDIQLTFCFKFFHRRKFELNRPRKYSIRLTNWQRQDFQNMKDVYWFLRAVLGMLDWKIMKVCKRSIFHHDTCCGIRIGVFYSGVYWYYTEFKGKKYCFFFFWITNRFNLFLLVLHYFFACQNPSEFSSASYTCCLVWNLAQILIPQNGTLLDIFEVAEKCLIHYKLISNHVAVCHAEFIKITDIPFKIEWYRRNYKAGELSVRSSSEFQK